MNENQIQSLKQLCRGIVPESETVPDNISVNAIVTDSRLVQPGSLFVAIRGYKVDGHNYLDEAINKGATAVLVEKEINNKTVPVLRVSESRKALALLANRFFGEPSQELMMVGITGTNGKTTVAYLIESILSQAGIKTGLLGTVIYRWGGYEQSAERTTPEATFLHDIMRKMQQDGVKAVVMEVSSHALALDRVLGIPYRAAIFTNLSRDHLDFHSSEKDYAQAKAKLFGMLKSGGVGIINGDDPKSTLMLKFSKERMVTFGEKKDANYRINNIRYKGNKVYFGLEYLDKEVLFTTSLWGKFNVFNAAAAGIVGLELGLDIEAIRTGIDNLSCVPGRMEGIESNSGFKVVIDYAHTPDALKNILSAVREFTRNRLIVVFGCGGDRDKGKRSSMGKYGTDLSDMTFITSDNPRTENPRAIIDDILKDIEEKKSVLVIIDRKEAIHRALEEAHEGDTVVIAGKGHETYQEIGIERIPFDDRVVVKEYLISIGKL
jgi:UDP-N-acetylmuramoyl-L-alanyl-D-glutamate--2,6-diaminopimelate ligase